MNNFTFLKKMIFILILLSSSIQANSFMDTLAELTSDEHLNSISLNNTASISQPFILHPSWYKITHKAEPDYGGFGSPMVLKNIGYRGKKWNCGDKYCYTYGITIKRPGNDRGNGILRFGDIPFSIEYWVGDIHPNVFGIDMASTIAGGYSITKVQGKGNDLTLVFNKAFIPGKYKLKIAPFPYPTVRGSTLMKFVEYYRHDYKSVADETYKYYKYYEAGHTLASALYGLVGGKLKDISVNTVLIKVIDKLGVHLVLEIPAVMPDIIGMHAQRAHSELLKSSLRPESKNWGCKKTQDKSLFGKVFKAQFAPGKLLNLNQKVIYEYYCLNQVVSNVRVMPNIKGRYTKEADNLLRQAGLTPAPGQCVATQNKRLHNKVFKHQFKPGQRLKANQRVPYKYYCYEELEVTGSFTGYTQCPKRNPGKNPKNKFDTNNNSKDGTYIICNYFRDGALQYQAPYLNGQKHGLILISQGASPHRLADLVTYKNGLKEGVKRTWVTSGNHYYLLRESMYSKDKQKTSIQWHSTGKISAETEYKSNGRTRLQYKYNKHGKFTYCTEWDSTGHPMDCKTKRRR